MAELTDRQHYWHEHLNACKAQGLSMRAYADAEGLNLNSFYAWKRKLQSTSSTVAPEKLRQSSSALFVPVELSGSPPPDSVLCIELPNGLVLHWPLTVQLESLKNLLPILAGYRP